MHATKLTNQYLPMVAAFVVATLMQCSSAHAEALQFDKQDDRIDIRHGEQPLMSYVFRDDNIQRPYIAHVRTLDGIQVTRHHPPLEGEDATDHATMHPGVWLAFGDINGADFWRNKAHIVHTGFAAEPTVVNGHTLSWTAINDFRNGDELICTALCRHSVVVRSYGIVLLIESTFKSTTGPIIFGDQEELGLGFRVASPLRVRDGNGRILISTGGENEQGVRGTNAEWADYSGTIDGRRVGMTLMPDPRNFRKSWYHARDYGFLCANPFGRHALTGGEKSEVVVPAGELFHLRYGLLIHSSPTDDSLNPANAYLDYLEIIEGTVH